MTDEKPKTPGMAEVSVEFEHEVRGAGPDPLLARIAEFHELHVVATSAREKWIKERHRVEELPDTPPLAAQGITELAEKCRVAWDRRGAAANAVFDTPAHSLYGAVEKLKILRMALGDFPGDDSADGDLEAYQTTRPDKGLSWFELVIADLERLASVPTPEDPVLVLKRDWDARDQRLRDEPDDSDEVRDPLVNARTEVEYAIHRTPATTLEGVALKLWLWTRIMTPGLGSRVDWWKAPVADMHGLDHMPVASALQDLERMSGVEAPRTVALATATEPGVIRLAALWGEYQGALGALCDATEAEEAGRGIFNTANIVTEPEQEALAAKESAALVHENEAWAAFLEAPCQTMAEVLFKVHTVHEQLKEHAFASRTEDLFYAAMRDYEPTMGEGAATTNRPSETVAPEPPAGVGFMAKSVPLIRAKSSDLERAVSNLEGASNALNNFAQTDDLPTEVDIGLQWLAYQIDAGMVDLRDEYDKLHGDAGGPETKGARP